MSMVICVAGGRAARTPAIERLLESSDAVVIGEVTYGTSLNGMYSFTLVPDRILKGNLKPRVALQINYNARAIVIKGSTEVSGQYGLWFLARDKAGSFALRPPKQQSLPLEFVYYALPKQSPAANEEPEEVTVAERVFRELANAVEVSEKGQRFNLLADGILRCVGITGSREALERWSGSSSSHLRVLGLTGLIMLEDPLALDRSRDVIASLDDTYLRNHFFAAISAYRNPDPVGVRAIGEMATEESAAKDLQIDGAQALRSIHTKEALPYLAKLLDSKDPHLRGQAVAGFTYFVNNWPIETQAAVVGMAFTRPVANTPYRTVETERHSSMGSFERAEDEQAAVQFWKNWWAEHQQELSKPEP
ncbi:MAG: hypothetical protein IT159_12225 [Bryobacterales bacterium]|nr:hypothetical protein [Bryobacterales bacterium]